MYKIYDIEQFRYLLKNFRYGRFVIETDCNVEAMQVADDLYTDLLELYWDDEDKMQEALRRAMDRFNSFIDFRIKNPVQYLCVVQNPMSEITNVISIRQYFNKLRNSKVKKGASWLSLFEVSAYLENGYMVYIIKDKDKSIEKEIQCISEL